MPLPIADVHAISFRLPDESVGGGGALIANTEVDVSVFDGPTVFVTVVRMMEADAGVGCTALGPSVMVAAIFDGMDDMLLMSRRQQEHLASPPSEERRSE